LTTTGILTTKKIKKDQGLNDQGPKDSNSCVCNLKGLYQQQAVWKQKTRELRTQFQRTKKL